MSYCEITDISAVIANDDLVQLTNDSGGSTVDNTKITEAISYVDSIMDGYLRGRYSLPLSTVPDVLTSLAIDFTVYRLYSRRLYTEIPPSVDEKYREVVKTLKDIQGGRFNLGIETASSNSYFKTNKTSSSKEYNSKMWDTY